MTTTASDPRASRRCQNTLNPLHSSAYFSPEFAAELSRLGLEPGSMTYFAGRAAPLGAVGAGTVTATFYNFNHDLVARHIPRAWTIATPEAVIDARLRAVDTALTRLLGADTVASPEMAEAAALALRATEACDRAARPLYAANADLPVPTVPHLALWHAATLLREHRGDGHLAALVAAELDGLEAIVSHTATGKGFTPASSRPAGAGRPSSGPPPRTGCASAGCSTRRASSPMRASSCGATSKPPPTASTGRRTSTSAPPASRASPN